MVIVHFLKSVFSPRHRNDNIKNLSFLFEILLCIYEIMNVSIFPLLLDEKFCFMRKKKGRTWSPPASTSQPENFLSIKVLPFPGFRDHRPSCDMQFQNTKHLEKYEQFIFPYLCFKTEAMFMEWGICLNEYLNIMNSLSYFIWLHNWYSEPRFLCTYMDQHQDRHIDQLKK